MSQFIDQMGLLEQQELHILQEADACPYEIGKAKSLGMIHAKIPVYIYPRATAPRIRTTMVTAEELKWMLDYLKQLIGDLENQEDYKNREKIINEYCKIREKQPGEQQKVSTLLGEYIPDSVNPRVHLYILTIREAAEKTNGRADWLLAQVYAHEMHHAAYHTDHSIGNNTNSYVEEPMAELGMLCWAKAFEQYSHHIGFHKDAIRSVQDKRDDFPEYGFGAFLSQHHIVAPQMLVDAVKPLLDSSLIRRYSLPFRMGIYPWTAEPIYAHWLKQILLGKKPFGVPHSSCAMMPVEAPTMCNKEAIAQIVDMLPQELFENPDITFCDPFYLSADFVAVVEARLDKGLSQLIPDQQARLHHIRKNQIFHRKPDADVRIWCDEQELRVSEFNNTAFNKPNCSYYQNLLGEDSLHQQFIVVMGVPPFKAYDTAGNEIRHAWEYATINGASITDPLGGYNLFCTPANWYYYSRSRFNWRRYFIYLLMRNVSVVRDFEDSTEIFPQYPRIAKGVSAILLLHPSKRMDIQTKFFTYEWEGALFEGQPKGEPKEYYESRLRDDFSFISSDGNWQQRPRINSYGNELIFRYEESMHILDRRGQYFPTLHYIFTSSFTASYSITLDRMLKRVNGEWRLARTGSPYASKSITLYLDLPSGVTPPMVDAFFESALATFIVMEYSGISKYSMPEVKKYAFNQLPNIVDTLDQYVQNNKASAATQVWDDEAFFDLYGLSCYEWYIHNRLRYRW